MVTILPELCSRYYKRLAFTRSNALLSGAPAFEQQPAPGVQLSYRFMLPYGHRLIPVPPHPARGLIGLGGVQGHPRGPTSWALGYVPPVYADCGDNL